jgi:hypothetical protein
MQYARVIAGATGQIEHVFSGSHLRSENVAAKRRTLIKTEVAYGRIKELHALQIDSKDSH